MSFSELRKRVWETNVALGRSGLVVLTWGNVSGIDRERGVFAIKPSGVPYDDLTVDDIVVVDLDSGDTVEGSRRPSSDTPTHRALYMGFSEVGGVVHTHSTFATSWAQAATAIPCLGTTHADTFNGHIPVTRNLTEEEIELAYEWETGRVIVAHFTGSNLNPIHTPGVLLPHHGPFTWGHDAVEALEHAIILEAVAEMAWRTRLVRPEGPEAPHTLVRKHFERKHGPEAYYGQK